LEGLGEGKDVGALRSGADTVGRLGEAIRRLAQRLDDKFQEFEALLRVTQRINSGLILEDVLDQVYESFREILPYDRIGFALLDETGTVLTARWARAEYHDIYLPIGFSAGLEGSSLQRLMATGKPRVLNHLDRYLEHHPRSESTRRIVKEGIRSSLTCPLIALGRPVGFIFLSSFGSETYEQIHIELFQQVAGQLALLVEKSQLYGELLTEKQRSERLLRNILPAQIAERLKHGEEPIADAIPAATVFFADIVGFTPLAESLNAESLVRLLREIFIEMDGLCEEFGLEKIKTIGDAYMAAAGVPLPAVDHAARCADFALAVIGLFETMPLVAGTHKLRVRIGLHSGPLVAGVIGKSKFSYDLWGDTVNLASRMESHGSPGKVHVTGEVRDLLVETHEMEDCGSTLVKGKGELETYFVLGRKVH